MKRSSLVLASMIGTLIEWYDVFIFGTGAFYISKELFPPSNPTVALLNTFLVFALGFVTRPIGAIIFGHYGDKIGRKVMLLFTLLSSGIASGLVGVLPTYAEVGILTVILLVILRLVLGFGLGGEWGGAVLLITENFESRKTFWVSFVQATVGIGLMLGSIVFLVLSLILPERSMLIIGWRIPFLLSFVMMGIGIFIRLKVEETKEFVKAKENKQLSSFPAKDLFRSFTSKVILGTFLAGSLGTIFYVGAVLLPAIMEQLKIISPSQGFTATLAMGAFDAIFAFIGGALSARINDKNLLIVSNLLGLLLLYPSFYLKEPLLVIFMISFYGIAHGIGYSPLASILSSLFPTSVRYSGSSSAYQFGNSFIGGPASYASDFLGSISYSLYPVFTLIMIVIAIGSLISVRREKIQDRR